MSYNKQLNDYYNDIRIIAEQQLPGYTDILDWKWYRIPGYNGYEYNFEHKIVRSIKNFNKHPYGKLIKKYDNYYKLSNDQNDVEKVYIDQIENLIKNNKLFISRPLPTLCTNLGSRNIVTRAKKEHGKKIYTEIPDFSYFITD